MPPCDRPPLRRPALRPAPDVAGWPSGRRRTLALVRALGLLAPLAALAGERGWLHYADGNVLSGSLLQAARPGGGDGLFRSDRFGELRFSPRDASFRPGPIDAAASAPVPDAAASAPPASPGSPVASPSGWNAPAQAPLTPTAVGSGWRPTTWSIAVAADWKRDTEATEVDLNTELSAHWLRPHDDLTATLRADYKVREGAVDNNEQVGRVRWFHTVHAPWLSFAQLYAERHTLSLAGLDKVDYLLLQGTLGVGWRHDWSADGFSRFVLAYNRFEIDLLDYGLRAHDDAMSLLTDHTVRLSERVSLTNTTVVYLWDDDDPGIEAETELTYALTAQLSLGLMHRYLNRGVNLTSRYSNELRLTTRFTF
jgi:hypothetical protein